MKCFKCNEREGIERKSHAMRRDWYDVHNDSPARSVYLCVECYVPDTKASKRTETHWEAEEAIWGEAPDQTEWDEESIFEWRNRRFGDEYYFAEQGYSR